MENSYIMFGIIRISTRPNKAITPEDYISLTDNKTLTFLVNEVEKTVSVKIINDKLTEDEQMFDLLLMGQNGSTVIPNCKTPPVIIVSNDGKTCININNGINFPALS